MNKNSTLKSRIRFSFLFWLLAFNVSVFPQTRITGYVFEAKTHKPLANANILVQGTQLGAASGPDGYYEISNLSPGTYTVEASVIGYKPEEIENVVVRENSTVELTSS